MKRILSVLAFLFLIMFQKATAQLNKGNVLVGGNIANLNFDLNKGGAVDIDIEPSAAWFIKDNVALGGRLTIHPTFYSDGGGSVFTYAIDALGRYYVNDPKVNLLKQGRWFFEGLIGIGGTNYSEEFGGGSTNGLDFGFGPGYAYFITSNVALETLLEYRGTVGFGSEAYRSNLNLSFGFQIYLPGRATVSQVKANER